MTETQNSALIRIEDDRNLERLGVCASAVAENIACMSNDHTEIVALQILQARGILKEWRYPVITLLGYNFIPIIGTNPYKKDAHEDTSKILRR